MPPKAPHPPPRTRAFPGNDKGVFWVFNIEYFEYLFEYLSICLSFSWRRPRCIFSILSILNIYLSIWVFSVFWVCWVFIWVFEYVFELFLETTKVSFQYFKYFEYLSIYLSISWRRPRCLFSSALRVALLSVLVGHLELSAIIIMLLDKFEKNIQKRKIRLHWKPLSYYETGCNEKPISIIETRTRISFLNLRLWDKNKNWDWDNSRENFWE